LNKEENIMAEVVPEWVSNLEDEELSFIKKFIIASGSLKEMANQYNVTYPTVRLRLDKIIQKIMINDRESNEPYIALIKKLAIDDKLSLDTTKILINEYKKQRGNLK
jgi:hypothetical protein